MERRVSVRIVLEELHLDRGSRRHFHLLFEGLAFFVFRTIVYGLGREAFEALWSWWNCGHFHLSSISMRHETAFGGGLQQCKIGRAILYDIGAKLCAHALDRRLTGLEIGVQDGFGGTILSSFSSTFIRACYRVFLTL
jgi:hypothetical protein